MLYNFPDAEAYVYDNFGNGVNLVDYQHSILGSPMYSLYSRGEDNVLDFSIIIQLNKDGSFKKATGYSNGESKELKIHNRSKTQFTIYGSKK